MKWFIIRNVVENLKHFKVMLAVPVKWKISCESLMCLLLQVATDYLEEEKYVSISAVITIVKGLADSYSPSSTDSIILAQFKEKILSQLKRRFDFFCARRNKSILLPRNRLQFRSSV